MFERLWERAGCSGRKKIGLTFVSVYLLVEKCHLPPPHHVSLATNAGSVSWTPLSAFLQSGDFMVPQLVSWLKQPVFPRL